MSDHKRPLHAFVLVALIGALVLAGRAHSRAEVLVAHLDVVGGVRLAPVAEPLTPVGPAAMPVAEPQRSTSLRPATPVGPAPHQDAAQTPAEPPAQSPDPAPQQPAVELPALPAPPPVQVSPVPHPGAVVDTVPAVGAEVVKPAALALGLARGSVRGLATGLTTGLATGLVRR